MPPFHGSCLCGAIEYQVDQIESRMAHCHCKACRKFHGAAFSTFAEAKAENFRWLKGEELLRSFTTDYGSVRRFCSVCGSSLTFAPANDQAEVIEFALSTLDDAVDVSPDAHVYTNYKANWSVICDGLPQHQEGRQASITNKG